MKRSISSIRPWPKNGEERERRNESFPNTVVNSALTPIFVRAIRPRRGRGGFLFRTTAALSRAQVTHRYPPRLYDRLLRTGRSYLNLGYTASGRPCLTNYEVAGPPSTQNPIVRYTHWSVQRRIITCVAIVKIAGRFRRFGCV